MLYIISQVFGWVSTALRAGGMLAKDPMRIKWLVSGGNLGWMLSGILTGNIPLVVSNALCLVIMVVEIIKNKKEKKNKFKTSGVRQQRHNLAHGTAFGYKPEEKVGRYTKATISLEEKPVGKET